MFPNPQDALPLPLRSNLERYKKLAKDLVKVCKSVDPDAIGDWAEAWVIMLVRQSGIKLGRKESVAIRRWTEQVEAFAQRSYRTRMVHSLDLQTHSLSSLAHTVLRVGPNSPNISTISHERVQWSENLKLPLTRSVTAT